MNPYLGKLAKSSLFY